MDFAYFIFGLVQNSNFQQQALDQSNQHHLDSLQQNEDHHRIGVSLDRELDYREKRRDIWGQVVEENNTLLIIQTVMFSAGFAIIVEGMPPEDTPEIYVILFSCSLAFSMCSLFLGINLGMIVHNRMARYRITDARQYYKTTKGIWQHKEVKNYWKKHCERFSYYSKRCFWVGMVFLLVCSSVLLWTRFLYLYKSITSSICFVLIVFFTLITFYFLRHEFDHEIVASQEDIQEIYKLFQLSDRPHLNVTDSEDSLASSQGNKRSEDEFRIVPLSSGGSQSKDHPAINDWHDFSSDEEAYRSDERKSPDLLPLFPGGVTPQFQKDQRFSENLV